MVAKSNNHKWLVLGFYMYLCMFTQIYWLNFAAIDVYMEKHFKMSAFEIMWLSLIFVVVTVILSIPSGKIIDKYGFKRGVSIGAFFISVFPFIRLLAPRSFIVLFISQFGIAISQPFILNAVTKMAMNWFSPKREAIVVGLSTLSLFVGIMIVLGITPWLIKNLSFEGMLFVYAAFSLPGALGFMVLVKPWPQSQPNQQEINIKITAFGELKHILKKRNFLVLSFVTMVGMGIFNSLITWLQKILYELHHISMVASGEISSILILSGIIGCFIIPMLSDKLNIKKPFLYFTVIISFCTTNYLIFANNTGQQLNAMLLGFALLPALPILFTMSAEITGQRYAGISIGYLQMMGNITSVILIATMEILRTITDTFVIPLCVLNGLWLLCFILLFFLDETSR